ncbi:hypothetical protein [Algisphaera agarilytica]|uniref:Phage gp6-like head-tail connector protein n=1 Tax=Algisphaera agarilytica TaxID=1385975 RepID=A0A7X0H7F5_9BACT|nr:hypothetical protein [Algisphaera agarilytica]MBB6429219.1 hypothetical protein [Algisphaera agarilytica]
MPNALAKLDDLKAALGFSGDSEDATLTSMLEAATASAARLVGVATLMRQVDIVEYPRPRGSTGSPLAYLSHYPVESINQIKLAGYTSDSDGFAEIDPLEANQFALLQSLGEIELFFGERFAPYPYANLVVYTAGYIDPSEASPPATALQAPADLQRAIVVEATRLWNTRRDAGIDEVDAGQGDTHRPGEESAHPQLVAACEALGRIKA